MIDLIAATDGMKLEQHSVNCFEDMERPVDPACTTAVIRVLAYGVH